MAFDRSSIESLKNSLFIKFHDELYRERGYGSYDEGVDPASLFEESPPLWGGMMLPDSIPLAGNGCGDFLLARFGKDGALTEILEWNHEGSYWHPSGLVPTYPSTAADALETCLKHLPPAQEPPKVVADLTKENVTLLRGAAEKTSSLRPEIAWPGALLGLLSESEGKLEDAIRWYARGLDGFSSTMAFASSWRRTESAIPDSFLHLSVGALGRGQVLSNPLLVARAEGPRQLRKYWMERGQEAYRTQDFESAYAAFYRAGWDSLDTNDIRAVLEMIHTTADKAGWQPLRLIAALHLKNFFE